MFCKQYGIKHDFLCINIYWALREMLQLDPERRGFQTLPRDPADVSIYSEKQLNDIKILSCFVHSRKYIPIEICMHLIVLSIRNFSGCKMQPTLHWLQYSTATNVLTLYNKSSQQLKLEVLTHSPGTNASESNCTVITWSVTII